VQARGVAPRTGNVLCFPHGDTASSLVRAHGFQVARQRIALPAHCTFMSMRVGLRGVHGQGALPQAVKA